MIVYQLDSQISSPVIHSGQFSGQQGFVPRGKYLFLVYFRALNSNMFPEFLYHPHLSLQVKGWYILRRDTKMCLYRGRHEEFKDFFSQEDVVMLCNDVCSVMEVLDHEYNPDQWRFSLVRQK